MLYKLLAIGFFLYLLSKLSNLFKGRSDERIKGKPKSDPIDYKNNDIQDVDFKDLDE